jgi:hypothetical protein
MAADAHSRQDTEDAVLVALRAVELLVGADELEEDVVRESGLRAIPPERWIMAVLAVAHSWRVVGVVTVHALARLRRLLGSRVALQAGETGVTAEQRKVAVGGRLAEVPGQSGVTVRALGPSAVRGVMAGTAAAGRQRLALGVAVRAPEQRVHAVVEGSVAVMVGDL